MHDAAQEQRLEVVGLAQLRGRVVADIGAGAGSFLDIATGFATRTIAVEPAAHFHATLRKQGHEVFSYATDSLSTCAGQADIVTSFAVIEHVEDARSFVQQMADLAKQGAQVIIGTPNANDWLIELLPAYASFFYRTVHRWYFNADTLGKLMRACGLQVERIEHRHRFDLSNALGWMSEGRPTGTGKLPVLAALDASYRAELERQGKADYLYIVARKS
jgi:2-polyprenyl-3-methyl-5-hydroxy-6-metoxy-1,4-benzoquinol methylase